MSDQILQPDLEFTKKIIAAGGDSLKKCYQCSTCTVVCDVTPGSKPFPRKEMLYAQWGLKDKLLASPDVWLCHQCSDCTAYCPRGAKPGEVLGAVRKMTIEEYAPIPALARMVNDSKFLLILFAIPAVIFMLELFFQGHLTNGIPRIPNGQLVSFSLMFPPTLFVDTIFVPTAIFAAICFYLGVKKYWLAMAANTPIPPKGDAMGSIIETIRDILTHSTFEKCNVAKDRSIAHKLVFYSFIGLALTTSIAVLYLYVFKWSGPYPQTNIIKWIGNVSGIALLIGITMVIMNRMKNKEKAGLGSYFDWFFISVVYGVALTGMLAQLLRLGNIAILAYPMYFAHLIFIFVLFAYAPFSKMAHMVYRTTALVFARYARRDK
ncbi:MAG TPA: quinone-interacting membrane-bound oxidoreductase complex subunit QmoC [Dissulfurispiraceae bacterium]|nr:quinone-interacting membrane-bound oxidoreductase complex subunit QmoC [Dissulfurispiraceae bacterium]